MNPESSQLVNDPWTHIEWMNGSILEEQPVYSPSWEGWKEIEHTELNTLKEKIDQLEVDGTWEFRKKLANPFELVHTHEEKNVPVSLTFVKPLSRSYFKMIEMLTISNFFHKMNKQKILCSAHVCEGPGGFIQGFIDLCEKDRKRIAGCLAMTLRPTQSQVPGWKRAAQFLKKNPTVKITYGADSTGDIYVLENQKKFVEELPMKAHLFTADGGFDFKQDYIHQELTAFRLIVSSFSVGFQSLANGGFCIIKLFDTFGNPMQEFIGYMSCFFKEWCLYKPAMSRPCNSERYFIGSGFRGTNDDVQKFFQQLEVDLREKDVHNLESLFQTHSLGPAIEYIQRYQKEFEREQIQTLQKAIEIDVKVPWEFWHKSYRSSERWCKRFQMPMKPILAPMNN
jgi:23S rRNA U2552 (ribose-2'-O)-methylase RlmE/FtsJ